MHRFILTVWATFLVALFTHSAWAEEDLAALEEDADDSIVYEVQAGDTLQSISERYLGGPEFMDELLGYNEVADPNAVVAGTLLTIPRKDRKSAINYLTRAEKALARAIDAEAETYAEKEFLAARELVEKSRADRLKGRYSQTVSQAKKGLILAARARQLADERAPIQQESTLTAVHNRVEISTGSGTSWKPARVGQKVQVNSLIRTGNDGRAEVTLADHSVIQINQASTVAIKDFVLDRRTGVRNSRLKVVLGSILGRVEPEKVEESQFEIDTDAASVAIRGTEVRVSSEAATTWLSVLHGLTSIEAGGNTIEVPGDFGTIAKNGRPPASPVELLDAPGGLVPGAVIHHTAIQTPEFQWAPIASGRLGTYHLEIAADSAFNEIVQDHRKGGDRFKANVLLPGEYFWRVSTIDRDGLEGQWSPIRKLVIKRNYEVEVHPTEPLIAANGVRLARPQIGYMARASRADTSVVRMHYSLDGKTYSAVDGPITLTEDGDYEVRIKGESADGDFGDVRTFSVRVDGTPPEVSATVSAPSEDPVLGKIVHLELAAEDANGLDRVEVSTDGKNFFEYMEPIAFRADEQHRVACRALDAVGNVSPVKHIDVGAQP